MGLYSKISIGSIDKLNHEMTSYKTRNSSYGNPTGCMAGTRVKILKDLEDWASDDLSSKVYWLVGMMRRALRAFSDPREQKKLPPSIFFASRISHSECKIVDFPVPAIPTSQ